MLRTCSLCLVAATLLSAQRRVPAEAPVGLSFRFLGPLAGNRISAVAGIPSDPSTYYAGVASGGIWQSTDGGNAWAPIFDRQPVAAIGALAVAPSNPNIVWAGTGEAWVIRDSDVMRNGIYKSTFTAAQTWGPPTPHPYYSKASGRSSPPQRPDSANSSISNYRFNQSLNSSEALPIAR